MRLSYDVRYACRYMYLLAVNEAVRRRLNLYFFGPPPVIGPDDL